MGKMSKFVAIGWDSHPIPNVGTVHTWWGEQSNIKGGDTSGKKGDTRGIILRDSMLDAVFY